VYDKQVCLEQDLIDNAALAPRRSPAATPQGGKLCFDAGRAKIAKTPATQAGCRRDKINVKIEASSA